MENQLDFQLLIQRFFKMNDSTRRRQLMDRCSYRSLVGQAHQYQYRPAQLYAKWTLESFARRGFALGRLAENCRLVRNRRLVLGRRLLFDRRSSAAGGGCSSESACSAWLADATLLSANSTAGLCSIGFSSDAGSRKISRTLCSSSGLSGRALGRRLTIDLLLSRSWQQPLIDLMLLFALGRRFAL